jgi:hypothetical protein
MKCNLIVKPIISTSVIILATIISTEGVGLLVLHHTGTPHNWLVLLDLFLVVIALLPFIFFFVYRPMVKYCENNNQLLSEKESKVEELEKALREITTLRGILPICASCKKIRDDKGYWNQIESYIRDHSEAEFSHGICPPCAENLYPDLYTETPEILSRPQDMQAKLSNKILKKVTKFQPTSLKAGDKNEVPNMQ